MAWLQLHSTVTADQVEMLTRILETANVLAISLKDAADAPIFEMQPGERRVWPMTEITALFDEQTDLLPVIAACRAELGEATHWTYTLSLLPDEDWVAKHATNIKPIEINSRLWIVPREYDTPLPNDARCVRLSPGLGFGSGQHATTQLCLDWLAEHLKENTCVVDYGCGSGILAIAAIKLGAHDVVAVDHDAQALTGTRDNARFNEIELTEYADDPGLYTCLPEHFPLVQADCLVSNILANPLMTLAPIFADTVKPGGDLVLSGILGSQAEAVKEAYMPWFEAFDITPADTQLTESWVRLTATRKA